MRAATSDQILTPEELYNWAKRNIAGVTILYVTIEGVVQHSIRYNLQSRYNVVCTVPVTRNYHCFSPDGDLLQMKRVSNDTIYDAHQLNDLSLKKNPLAINLENTLPVIMMRSGILA